jgi:hypothetical protein
VNKLYCILPVFFPLLFLSIKHACTVIYNGHKSANLQTCIKGISFLSYEQNLLMLSLFVMVENFYYFHTDEKTYYSLYCKQWSGVGIDFFLNYSNSTQNEAVHI